MIQAIQHIIVCCKKWICCCSCYINSFCSSSYNNSSSNCYISPCRCSSKKSVKQRRYGCKSSLRQIKQWAITFINDVNIDRLKMNYNHHRIASATVKSWRCYFLYLNCFLFQIQQFTKNAWWTLKICSVLFDLKLEGSSDVFWIQILIIRFSRIHCIQRKMC